MRRMMAGRVRPAGATLAGALRAASAELGVVFCFFVLAVVSPSGLWRAAFGGNAHSLRGSDPKGPI